MVVRGGGRRKQVVGVGLKGIKTIQGRQWVGQLLNYDLHRSRDSRMLSLWRSAVVKVQGAPLYGNDEGWGAFAV